MTMIAKDTRCSSKQEFEQLLRTWYDETEERTLGDLDTHPGVTSWIFVTASGHEVKVHADTNRDAVRRYLELVGERGPGLIWHVRHGNRGTLNKVCIEPDATPTKGLFMYTVDALPERLEI
jgi:hypothetical protein